MARWHRSQNQPQQTAADPETAICHVWAAASQDRLLCSVTYCTAAFRDQSVRYNEPTMPWEPCNVDMDYDTQFHVLRLPADPDSHSQHAPTLSTVMPLLNSSLKGSRAARFASHLSRQHHTWKPQRVIRLCRQAHTGNAHQHDQHMPVLAGTQGQRTPTCVVMFVMLVL